MLLPISPVCRRLFRAVLDAWATPVKAVGTEPKMALNAERIVDSGVLEGSLTMRAPHGLI